MPRESEIPAHAEDEPPQSKTDLARGERVGDHIVRGLLARGGCGAVYRAERATDGTRVAIKVLHASLASKPKMVERFKREVELVNMLRHPSIVEIHEVGILPSGRPFYVMEFLDGGTLDDRLRAEGRLAPHDALAVLEPVCAALEAAHAAGVVHRDVKASNIAFTGDPRRVKLLDFGIAKLLSPAPGQSGLTTVGRQLGTPTIMAPEQLRGEPIDLRIDVYALGVLLYRLLTGRPPFEGRSAAALARQHLEEPAPRPSKLLPLTPALDAVVLHCLEKRPERRFESTRAFLSALADALGASFSSSERGSPVSTRAVALYIDLRLSSAEDELDEALSRELGDILDLAEDRLTRAGFVLVQATGSGVLGVRPILGEPDEATRRDALALAASLHQQIARRPCPDARVHANVAVHAGHVLLRDVDPVEIVGGPLLRTAAWAPRHEVAAVFATPAALEGLAPPVPLS